MWTSIIAALAPVVLKLILNRLERGEFDEKTKQKVLEYINIMEQRHGGTAGDDAKAWEELDGDVDKWIAEQRSKRANS